MQPAEIYQFPRPAGGQVKEAPPLADKMKDGYVRTPNAVADARMKSPMTSRESRVFEAVQKATYGWQKESAWVAASILAKMTGMPAGKCSEALNSLIRKRVLIREGGGRSPVRINVEVEQWDFSEHQSRVTPKRTPSPEWGESPQDGVSELPQDGVANKDRKDSTSPYGEESMADANDEPTKSKRPALPNCPQSEMLDLWAETMPDKRQPIRSMWKGARAKNLAARWKQGFSITNDQTGLPLYTDTASGIEWWGRFFRFLRKSEFLMRDDSRFFGLEWVAKSENFSKILEMKYHGGES